MINQRTPRLYFTRWRCPVSGQRLQVVGTFNRVEIICGRLRRRGIAHRWGTCRPERNTPT